MEIDEYGRIMGEVIVPVEAGLTNRVCDLTNLETLPVLGKPVLAGIPKCYAASLNSFVIRADGSIAKCTVAFNDPRNKIGYITSSGKLKIESDKFSWWVRGNLSGDKDQLICPFKAKF